jgi:hypothetical protein
MLTVSFPLSIDALNKTSFTAAPVATPDYGVLNIGDAPFDGTSTGHFAGSSNGTYLDVNAASTFTGNLLDLQSAGTSLLKTTYQGATTALSSTSGVIPLTVRNSGGQTADLQQWLNQDGTVVLGGIGSSNAPSSAATARFHAILPSAGYVVGATLGTAVGGFFLGPVGGLQYGTDSAHPVCLYTHGVNFLQALSTGEVGIGSNFPTIAGVAGQDLTVFSGQTTNKALVIKAAASQTGDLQQWQNSSSTVLVKVDASGNPTFQPTADTSSSGTYVCTSIAPTINQSGTAGYTALKIYATETTTGSGSKLLADLGVGASSKFSVDNGGNIALVGTTATSATAGSNGAVPAQVAQYLQIKVGGTNYKIPLFNT